MNMWRRHITIDPSIRFGKPTIKGTRITVGDILGWYAAGMTEAEILEDFPNLTLEDLRAALAFAALREQAVMQVSAGK